MSSPSPVILILGAGANIGRHVARSFTAKGYKVAISSRSPPKKAFTSDAVYIPSDLSDPTSVPTVFTQVKDKLGIPSVVVYNAGAATPNDPQKPLSLGLESFTGDLAINTTSAFVAAQQAALAFEQLSESASRTFIYTGNICNTTTIPELMDLGVGKSATAHMIQVAVLAYSDKGFKFYYADERKPDGSAAYFDIDGEAHGKFYTELSEGERQGPWQQTFVKGVGYKEFPAA